MPYRLIVPIRAYYALARRSLTRWHAALTEMLACGAVDDLHSAILLRYNTKFVLSCEYIIILDSLSKLSQVQKN